MADTVAPTAGTARPRLWFALRAVAAAVALALVWSVAGGEAALQRLWTVEPLWVLLAVAALTLQTVLSARRWQITAAPLGLRIGLGRAVGEYFLSQLVNQALPGGVLGDAGRAVRSRHAADLSRAAQAVVIERLLGQVALLAVFAAGVVWLASGTAQQALLEPAAGLLAVAAIVLGGAFIGGGAAVVVVPRLRRMARSTAQTLRACVLSGGLWMRQAALSLAIVACNIAAFVFCFRATGTMLAPGVALVLIPLILLAMLVPLTVGGWGLREGTAAALVPLAGGTAEAGFAASVVFGLVLLISALPGVVTLLRSSATAN